MESAVLCKLLLTQPSRGLEGTLQASPISLNLMSMRLGHRTYAIRHQKPQLGLRFR